MKIKPQSSAERIDLGKRIDGTNVVMMTTLNPDGALVSRPMSPIEMDATGAIWFFTDLRSEKIEHLREVNIAFSDEDNATYVSISGHGEIHAEQAHIEKLWTPFARPWFPDGPESTNIALLKFVPDIAEYWDAPSSKMVRMFATAASIVANKPIGVGEHNTLTDLARAQ
jgi:general stress protein 26